MDFARKQLEKYGWTDGKGLGKAENGITEALKPKLKRSVTGIGHDPAANFTEHWWSALYDKAASNISVEDKNGKTKKIKTKNKAEFEISTSMLKIKKKSKTVDSNIEEQYSDFFVKKAILSSGGSKTEKVRDSDSEEEEMKDVFKMTDEELFAACGRRTAHKGARHGLRALGKLARIEQQEQELLDLPQYKDYSHVKHKKKEKLHMSNIKVIEDTNFNSDTGVTDVKKKKKKRKRCLSHGIVGCDVEYNLENKTETEIEELTETSSDKIKKRKVRDNNNVASNIEDNVPGRKSKQCKKQKCSDDLNENNAHNAKHKNKKKQRTENEAKLNNNLNMASEPIIMEYELEQNNVSTKHLDKKNKKKKNRINEK